MSTTPALDSTPSDDSKSLADLLREELALDIPAPAALAEPAWLIEARRAITAAQSRAELNAVCAPMRDWPEDRKVQIRPLRDARWEQLRATGSTPAHGVVVTAATAAAVVAPAPVEPAPSATLTEPPAQEARPMVAGWRRIEEGPNAGTWGVCVEHLQHGVAIEPPVPGNIVLVNRARGGGTQPKRITGIALVSGARGGYSICTVSDPASGERATLARPRGTAQAIPAHVAPTGTLAAELSEIAAEAASNAAVADLGAQGERSSAEGRRLGVGFSTWQQYAEALRRGGLQPATRAEYIATVRRMGGTIDESTLPPANAPSALPVGPGITYTPTGPGYFDRPRAERRPFQVGRAAQEVKSGAALLRIGDLIAGSLVGGAGGDFSWAGKGQVARAALLATLAEIGREGDAPAAKDAHAQAGRAVSALHALGYHVHAVQGTERKGLPSYVAHRYIVGRALTADARTVEIGAEYGRRVLVVDLHQDDTLHCTGDNELAARVRADFEARCAADTYISADLTTWLQKTLRNVHGATRFGVGWYVPAGQREAAERLTRAIAKIWGESWRHGLPIASCAHLVEGLTEGLGDEITKLEEAWTTAQEEARAAKRAQVTAAKAGGMLARIFEVGERVRGYAALLGDEAVAPLRTRITALDGAIRPLVDDTTARASMLEFS